MRIESVTATAFGPFSGQTLEFSPGVNVVYGPNESGKSSWHAAISAGMCGMRRTRGQPTREDRAFASRYRPWRGTAWRVSVVLVLDDGRSIEIEQSLGAGGRSVAKDLRTKKPLTGDIVRAGAVDATTLLGLTRDTALATVFVRQADMLRVLSDADALQEYLERAAATSAADTTADEALARIAAYKRDRVGLVRAGSRGPLANAGRRLKEARQALDKAEERFESYQDLLAQRQAADAEVREVERRVQDVVEHEDERRRREQWMEIRAGKRRLEQARRLTGEAAGTATAPADEELVPAVTRALATFEAQPAEPAELEGRTATNLEQQLATVPDMPGGDLEPADEVTAFLDRWRAERQRLAAHDENEPTRPGAVTLPVSPSELRRLADELELAMPEIDPRLLEEVERRRRLATPQYHPPAPVSAIPPPIRPGTTRQATVLFIFGGVGAVIGVLLAAIGQLIVGLLILLVGAGAAAAAALLSSKTRIPRAPLLAPDLPAQVTMPPPIAAADQDLPRLEARLALQQESQAQAVHRRRNAMARLAELGLPGGPDQLRQLAADGDVAGTAEARHREWRQRGADLEAGELAAADALRTALSTRGIPSNDGSDLDQVFDSYTRMCRRRAGITREASRRTDIGEQLVARRAAEASRKHDHASRQAAEQRLLDVARATGCAAPSTGELVDALRTWVALQAERDRERQHHDQTAARRDQVLDGLTLDKLEAQVASLVLVAGDPPLGDAPSLMDRSAELRAVQAHARSRRDLLAEFIGQIDGAEQHLLPVSPAIEAEARAAAEIARLSILEEDLDAASEILTAAQGKVHEDIAPVLNETIRPWVPRITCGRYDDIRVNPATLEVEAHEAGGQFHSATMLSHGTTEQLFLLLRLALAQRLTTTGEKAPIVLDDVTVQSDAERTVAVLDLLHDLSAQHQVVLFSQEEEVLRWAEQRLVPSADRLIRLTAPTAPRREPKSIGEVQ